MQDPTALVTDNASPEDLQFLEEQINAYNFAATGYRDARLLVILLRDSAGRIYAGLSGHTWGGAGEIRFLWVDESRRLTGIGTCLLRAAEEEARSRGCKLPRHTGRMGRRRGTRTAAARCNDSQSLASNRRDARRIARFRPSNGYASAPRGGSHRAAAPALDTAPEHSS